MGIELLDIALRGMATGMVMICIVVTSIDRITVSARIAFSLVAITSLARLWSTLPPGFNWGAATTMSLGLIGAWAAFALNWLLLMIFLDNRRFFGFWMISGAAISIGITAIFWISEVTLFVRIHAAAHFIALTVLILAAHRDDLMAARRRVRPFLAIILSVFSVNRAIMARPIVGPDSAETALAQTLAYSICVFLFVWWSLRADLESWPGEEPPPRTLESDSDQVAGAQKILIASIEAAMKQGIWRREGLLVADLAQEVNAPEHRVRKAINQILGHRNFASFINKARIEAAKTRLSRPHDVDVTILEIAYDVGFRSLGPFNRAFREATGQSPTEFRARNVANATVDYEKTAPGMKKTA